MGVAYRLVRPEPTIRQMMEIRLDPEYRLPTSPFGITPEQYAREPPVYFGRAVKWKGIKGLGLEGFIKELIARKPYPIASLERLAAGLRKAVKISKAYKGVTGTVIYEGKLYPAKAIAQKRWKEEHPEIK